ncbi:FAD-dependent oxidoreductase [Mycolicibacterium sp. BiH015]|uniref:FAD-dependent oxidoreductase n=1 Tax=Mycolicibacterium sp. BiH015 TaxID=3018808 RepID=UPI0022E523BF|nr:FAD-dependent oxidoreductase [Mycolicibacterium sp. BiH015]MDA2890715.1 FAD-dependent oxidoreductase [Mycolicibacterium sp. BiH015]
MPTVVVGAGPTGLFTAITLARRGRRVVIVDRDPGPEKDGAWRRRGVMQFEHAHTFRGPAVEALQDQIPDALRALRRVGARVVSAEDGTPIALHSRRSLFERVLRETASRQPGLTLITGHVDAVRYEAGRAVALRIGSGVLPADLVIDASGRASRVMREGAPEKCEGGPCAASYVSRQYRLVKADNPGPVNSPIGLSLSLDGYFAVAFLHDGANFSLTITHDGTDLDCTHCGTPRFSTPPSGPYRCSPSGSNPAARIRQHLFCPADGCTTAIAANWTTPGGPCSPG